MDQKLKAVLRGAFDAYLEQLEQEDFQPAPGYLPYGMKGLGDVQWPAMNVIMVEDELRELTNGMNSWHHDLIRWHAWNKIHRLYSEEDAWDVRREFVEPLAHACMLLPSSTRDQVVFVATNAMHQVRLGLSDGHRDNLEGDPIKVGDKPTFLTRRKKEERLRRVVSLWPRGDALLSALKTLDDDKYKRATSDYRNRSSHSIAPRFEIGITRTVTREVVPAEEMIRQPNGTYQVVPSLEKLSVRYGYGGTSPLALQESFLVNLEQYRRARSCFERYRDLLRAGLTQMPEAASTSKA